MCTHSVHGSGMGVILSTQQMPDWHMNTAGKPESTLAINSQNE